MTGDQSAARQCLEQAIELARSINIRYYLTLFYEELAWLLFEMKETAGAQDCCTEAEKLARAIGKKDTAFVCGLLRAKLLACSDQATALDAMRQLDALAGSKGRQALLCYEMFKLSKQEAQRSKALELYRELYGTAQEVDYRDKIEELEKNEGPQKAR
jgi:tetratricopeptide (TPR) repeat protein